MFRGVNVALMFSSAKISFISCSICTAFHLQALPYFICSCIKILWFRSYTHHHGVWFFSTLTMEAPEKVSFFCVTDLYLHGHVISSHITLIYGQQYWICFQILFVWSFFASVLIVNQQLWWLKSTMLSICFCSSWKYS